MVYQRLCLFRWSSGSLGAGLQETRCQGDERLVVWWMVWWFDDEGFGDGWFGDGWSPDDVSEVMRVKYGNLNLFPQTDVLLQCRLDRNLGRGGNADAPCMKVQKGRWSWNHTERNQPDENNTSVECLKGEE